MEGKIGDFKGNSPVKGKMITVSLSIGRTIGKIDTKRKIGINCAFPYSRAFV